MAFKPETDLAISQFARLGVDVPPRKLTLEEGSKYNELSKKILSDPEFQESLKKVKLQ